MATKTDFTPDEWAKLVESVMLASIAITAADPSGLWGTLKEGFATAKVMSAAKNSGSGLITEVVTALQTSEGRTIAQDQLKQRMAGAKAADIVQRSVSELAAVGALLDSKAGSDAPIFKQWLFDTAVRVAEASTEGDFLGFGGVKVSDKEKATLGQIAGALNIANVA
ncbi:MAG: hypothetical protein R3D67_01155 [Hyphomicrobiaceae bacterium]